MTQMTGELTVDAVQDRWDSLKNYVIPPMGIPFDHVNVDPSAIRNEVDPCRKQAIIQSLQDLGYLPEPEETSEVEFSWGTINQALSQWRTDTLKSSIKYRLLSNEGKPVSITEENIPEDSVSLLTEQTSYDGNLQLFRFPKPGEAPSLESRIALFRLKTYGKFDGDTGVALTESDVQSFLSLRDDLGLNKKTGLLALTNLLGNAEKVVDSFRKKYVSRVFVVEMPDPEVPSSPDESKKLASQFSIETRRNNIRFQGGYGGIRPPRPRIHQIPILRFNAKNTRGPTLQEIFDTRENTLALQLFQLRLWQAGYYHGAIDAVWAEQSQEALCSFVNSFRDQNIAKEKLLVDVRGGCVINLFYALKLLHQVIEDSASMAQKGTLEELTNSIMEQSDSSQMYAIEKQAREELQSERKLHLASTVKIGLSGNQQIRKSRLRRRRDFSLRGIFSSIAGWFRRFFNNIKKWAQKIRDAIIKGIKSVLNVFRFLLNRIRSVVRITTLAVQRFYYWISGKPFGVGNPKTGQFILTKWSVDFDTINFITPHSSSELLQSHISRVNFMNASFYFVTGLALQVVGLITPGPISWLRTAYEIYQKVKEWNEWKSQSNPFLDPETLGFITT